MRQAAAGGASVQLIVGCSDEVLCFLPIHFLGSQPSFLPVCVFLCIHTWCLTLAPVTTAVFEWPWATEATGVNDDITWANFPNKYFGLMGP